MSARARKASDVTADLARVIAQLPVGEVRAGQQQMAEAVADALASGNHVAVAAGTGTGKSLGYLVPAVASGMRVVVATATKGLQDQLASKDLPLIEKGIGRKIEWAVLKGRSNYLCRQAIAEVESLGAQERLDTSPLAAAPPLPKRRRKAATTGAAAPGSTLAGPPMTAGEQVTRLVAWASETDTGDRAELDFEPLAAAWGNVSVTADQCPGAHRCPQGGDCFAEKARQRAAAADVIIVNIHLLGAHLRSGGVVLPEHDALVVDEAHEMEDILAASLGVEISAGRLRGIAVTARAALAGVRAGERALTAVDGVMTAAARYETVLEATPERRLPPGLGAEVSETVAAVAERLARMASELRKHSDTGGSSDPGSSAGAAPGSDSAQRCARSLLAVERCREELQGCLAAGRDEVIWVSGGDRKALRSAPLDVSAQLAEQVFSEMPVVLTSATMAPGLAVRLGARAGDVRELDVGSPFDYEHHGLLYCAVKLPDRRTPGAEEHLHDELESLILAAGGRTLALFTSRRAMLAAASILRERVPWPIHAQGDLPKAALVSAFSGEEESCLFATMGLWQGLDVPGTTLSLVVLDKIPFPRPDDPLMSARREAAGPAGFRSVDLPRAATLLAQGAGRLIRTATDKGVVAVLDPRLATASYSGYLVRALPKMRRTRDRDEAISFLHALRSEAEQAAG